MEKKKNKIYSVIKNIFDIIIVLLLVILSIKKGGFYKYDTLFFNLGILVIGTVYLVFKLIKINRLNKSNNENKKVKIDVISLLLFGLSISYFLPILFKNYANINDSVFEMVRYYCLFLIYNIVKNSNNKKIYVNAIIVVTLVQCIIGVDGIANRYLALFFSNFRTGYLSQDITRMSANIQYANVFAMLCLISSILIIDKLLNSLSARSKIKNSVYFLLLFIFISSIILSSSRTVMLLTLISFIIILIMNRKEKDKIIYLLSMYCILIIITCIYTTLIYKDIQSNLTNIYSLFGISIVMTLIISYIFNNIYYVIQNLISLKTNISNYNSMNFKFNIIIILVILLLILYIIIGLRLTKPLYISSDFKMNSVSREIYDINKNMENDISFKVSSNDSDSRFKITIYTVDKEFKSEVLKEINYYDNTSWNFDIKCFLTENVRNIKMEVKCDKGSISLGDFYINGKEQVLDYSILPSVVIYRVKDILHNSNSATDRVTYCKDAFKIITKSSTNFLIGTGGEGFSHLYKEVQEVEYNSTEVHNSFIQIFVESGIIGFLIIASIIVLGLLKGKNNTYKLAFVILVIHSIVDLNFSYMLMISIFGILIAMIDLDVNILLDINAYRTLLSLILAIVVIVTIIVLNANIAQNIKIPQINTDRENYDIFENDIINKYKLRIKLDPYDNEYKKAYNNLISK